jgi:hypothetical protein
MKLDGSPASYHRHLDSGRIRTPEQVRIPKLRDNLRVEPATYNAEHGVTMIPDGR